MQNRNSVRPTFVALKKRASCYCHHDHVYRRYGGVRDQGTSNIRYSDIEKARGVKEQIQALITYILFSITRFEPPALAGQL